MYNRHLFEKNRSTQQKEKKDSLSVEKQRKKHQSTVTSITEANQLMSHHYKERVNDFLLKMAKDPKMLGKYQPPIKDIIRSAKQGHLMSTPQMFINGFKNSRDRIQVTAN